MTALSRRPRPPSQLSERPSHPAAAGRLDGLDLCALVGRTLADGLTILPSASNLTPRQRQELTSAVHTVARVLGEAPSRLPANRRALTRRLGAVSPIAHGLSKRTWSNVRSRLNTVLDLVLPAYLNHRRDLLLEPEWKELQDRIADQWARRNLSRLFHFCSEAGISPVEINAETLSHFREYLADVRLKNPVGLLRETRRAWNHACEKVPNWPGTALPAAVRADAYVLPWSSFPDSLHGDLCDWLDSRMAEDVPFDLDDDWEKKPPKKIRTVTRKHREYQVRQFASALVQQGIDPESLMTLADVVRPEMLRRGARFYYRSGKIMPCLAGLLAGLQTIARYRVKSAPADLQKIQTLLQKAKPKRAHRGMTEKNRLRLHPILDDASDALALLRLPQKLVSLADNASNPRRAALLMQTALAIEILIMAPLRIGNLAALDTARHLVLPQRAGGKVRIAISADEVKNDVNLRYPLPEPTVALLRRYLAEARPVLAESNSTALFPGHLGRAKNPQALGRQITKAVSEHTGFRMHPHLFRHAMISLYLKVRKGDLETARLVLGHKSLETTAGTYAFVEVEAALERFWGVVLSMREGGAP